MALPSALAPHPFFPGSELSPGGTPPAMVIDFGGPKVQTTAEGTQISPNADGSVTVDFSPADKVRGHSRGDNNPEDFGCNLAEHLDDTEKANIVEDVIRWTEADIESRKPWLDKLADGLVLLGVIKDASDLGPMSIAENVTHPLLAEAAVQYQSRAITELIPPTGPAKGEVLGTSTKDKEASAQRLSDYLNFCLMVEDKSFYPEFDRMLFVQSYEGSQFRKICFDEIDRKVVSRWVKAQNFVVPYGAASLQGAPRYCHVYEIEHNDVLKLQETGFFIEEDLAEPGGMSPIDYQIKEKKDEAAGEVPSTIVWEMHPHVMMECHANWDLIDYPDENDKNEPTGIAIPYIAHVDYDSRKLLGLYRNWKEDDALKKKRVWFVHYPFIPGDGFYSYGYIHLAAGLARGATTALRLLLIGSAFASIGGGFKSKTNRTAGSLVLKPGEFQDTDMDYEELSKAFYQPNFKEPSQALFQTLGLLVDSGQRLFSTQEAMVGDAANTGPVGTTVALIEEGKKVFSAVHKRGHYAMGEELQIHREVHRDHLPAGGYPYDVPGDSRQVFEADFGAHSNIIPVSDPNIFSTTQRIAMAQGISAMSEKHPDLYDLREVNMRMLEAMRVPDPQGVLPEQDDAARLDPITENAMILTGRPVRVFVDQAHQFHIPVHRVQLEAMNQMAPQNPLVAQRVPIMLAHMAEHTAYEGRLQMAKMIGMELPPVNLGAKKSEHAATDMPPELDAAISQKAAQAVSQIPTQPSPGDQAQAKKEIEQQQQKLQADQQALEKEKQGVAAESQNVQNMRSQLEKEAMAAEHQRKLDAVQRESQAKDLAAQMKKTMDDAVNKVTDSVKEIKLMEVQAVAARKNDVASQTASRQPIQDGGAQKEILSSLKEISKEVSANSQAIKKMETNVESVSSELATVTEKMKTKVFKGTIAGKDVSMTMDHGDIQGKSI